ncbi:MAG: cytidine deaminase [Myxococcota bacterium]
MAGRKPAGRAAQQQAEQLVSAALAARSRAYAPYSQYQVGAALKCRDGTLVTGCNVENSAYPLCICAERVAMAAAVAQGRRDFVSMAIATLSSPPGSPCGSCRQFMHELAPDLELILCNPDGEVEYTTVGALLPRAFGPRALAAKSSSQTQRNAASRGASRARLRGVH